MLEKVWRKGNPLHYWWECRLIQPLWGKVWRFFEKSGIKSPYDTAIQLLGIYPQETKTEKDTCTPVFIAALFTIARMWKQPRCPSGDEWIKKLWYIYTMIQFSKVAQSCPTLCNPMNRSTPGLPIHHKLPEST